MPNARTLPAVDGTEAYSEAVVVAGADSGSAVFKRAKTTPIGKIPRIYLASGNTDSTLLYSRAGIISSSSAGSTTFLIKTLAAMGFTRDGTNPLELAYFFQRTGTGPLFVNADTGVTIVWNDHDPQYLAQYHEPVMLLLVGANIWSAS